MNKGFSRIVVILLLAANLYGCAAVIAGGAVAGLVIWHDRRTTGTILDDNSIEFKINQSMKDDPTLVGSHVNPVSYNNVLLLVGQVPSEDAKARIEDIARDVPRVRSLYNEIDVAAATPLVVRSSDTWITTRIKKDMLLANNIDISRIKVVTENGVVYLMGIVAPHEEDIAAEVARSVSGVKKVVKIFEELGSIETVHS